MPDFSTFRLYVASKFHTVTQKSAENIMLNVYFSWFLSFSEFFFFFKLRVKKEVIAVQKNFPPKSQTSEIFP